MPNLTKTKVLIFVIMVLLVANVAMLLSFGMKKPEKQNEHGRGPNVMSSILQEQVGFSNQQMDKLKDLRKQHWDKMHQLFEVMRQAKIGFYQNISKPEISDSTLQTEAAKIGETQQAIDIQTFRNFRELRALCTPEQLPRYDSLIPGVIQNMWFPHRGSQGKEKDSGKSKSSPHT
jgi:protein CpxP